MTESELISRSVVIFELPLGLNLPDGEYPVNMDTVSALIVLKRIKKTDPVGLGEVKIADGAEIIGDRWGRLFHTGVNVHFGYETPAQYSPTLEFELRKTAIEIINRLLVVYSFVVDEPIQKLAQVDIFTESFRHFNSQGKEVPGCVFSLGTGGTIMRMGDAANSNSKQLDKIRTMLEQNQKISLVNELILNAKNHLFYDDYNVSVLEVGTAFETFIDEFLFHKYKSQGIEEPQIIIMLQTGLQNLLKEHVKKVTSFDFGNSAEYSEWYKNAYQIRNYIVHEGKILTKQEAVNAINTYIKSMKFLSELK